MHTDMNVKRNEEMKKEQQKDIQKEKSGITCGRTKERDNSIGAQEVDERGERSERRDS